MDNRAFDGISKYDDEEAQQVFNANPENSVIADSPLIRLM